jgi:TPR repeat protein
MFCVFFLDYKEVKMQKFQSLAPILLAVALTACNTTGGLKHAEDGRDESRSVPTGNHTAKFDSANRMAEAGKGNLFAIHSVQARSFEMNESGLFVSPRGDVATPAEWLQKGVAMGDALSQARMAYYLLYGDTAGKTAATRDPARAQQLARDALANKKFPLGFTSTESVQAFRELHAKQLGQEVEELARRAQTLVEQLPKANQGDVAALHAVSQAYLPFGVNRLWYNAPTFSGNQKDHRQWLRRAADAGHPDAITGMVALTSGNEKRQWEMKAANLRASAGNLTAQAKFDLGTTYRRNDQDAEALKWFRQAAAEGHKPAQKAVLQLTDANVVRLMAAANQNNTAALLELGDYFQNGNWEGRDNALALEWYLKASARGNSEATYRAALIGPANKRSEQMSLASRQGHAGARAWLEAEHKRSQEEFARYKANQEAELRNQAEQRAQQDAFVARINREGSTDAYEIEVYCRAGGPRCSQLRNAARNAQNQRNRDAESANLRRIQEVHSGGSTGQAQRDAAAKRSSDAAKERSECLERKSRAMSREKSPNPVGFSGNC